MYFIQNVLEKAISLEVNILSYLELSTRRAITNTHFFANFIYRADY